MPGPAAGDPAPPAPPAPPGSPKKSSSTSTRTSTRISTQASASSAANNQDPTSGVDTFASTVTSEISFSQSTILSEETANAAATDFLSPSNETPVSPTVTSTAEFTKSPSPNDTNTFSSTSDQLVPSSISNSATLLMLSSSPSLSITTAFITTQVTPSATLPPENNLASNSSDSSSGSSKPPKGLYVALAFLIFLALIGFIYFLIRRRQPIRQYTSRWKRAGTIDHIKLNDLEMEDDSRVPTATTSQSQEVGPLSHFSTIPAPAPVVAGTLSRSNSNNNDTVSMDSDPHVAGAPQAVTSSSLHRSSSFTEHLDINLSDQRISDFPSVRATTVFSRQSWANYPFGSVTTGEDSRPPSYSSTWTMGGAIVGANRSRFSGALSQRESVILRFSTGSAPRPLSFARNASFRSNRRTGRLMRSTTRGNLERVSEVVETGRQKKSRRASVG